MPPISAHLTALPVEALAENLIVEHGLLERDRQRLLCAEADRVVELLLVLDAADLGSLDRPPRRGSRRESDSRARPPRAGSATSPVRGSGSRCRAASGPRCRRSRLT